MYIYGKNVAKESLSGDTKIHRAYLSKGFRDKEIVNMLINKHVKINYVDNIVLDKKVDGLHQGVVLEIDDVRTYTLDEFFDIIRDKKKPLVVMLDHLEDPHNFGAIIRTCEALGVDGIIIPDDRCVGVTSTVVKVSAGAIERMPIVRVSNLYSSLEKLKKNGFWIFGTDMDGSDYAKNDYDMAICLIIGNEGKGISNILRKNCDFIIGIPMSGKINSLNASVSCGIILSRIVSER